MPEGCVCEARTQGQETARCFLVSHKRGWECFLEKHGTWLCHCHGTVSGLILGCHDRILWRKTTCRTPSCNVTGRVALSKRRQTLACRGEAFVCLCADRLCWGLIFWPPLPQVGGGRRVWGRPGAEGGLACTAAPGFFLTWNFHMTKRKRSLLTNGSISIP